MFNTNSPITTPLQLFRFVSDSCTSIALFHRSDCSFVTSCLLCDVIYHFLRVNYSTTVREMCNSKNLTDEGREEHLLFTIVSQEPPVHVHNPNFSDPIITINIKIAQDAHRPLGDSHPARAAPNEDQWFFFSWEGIPEAVRFVVVNVTSPTRQCATVAVRNTSCVLNKENIMEYDHGLHLTMTRRAAIIVQRTTFPELFYVSVLAETDDEPCGLPANETGRSRTKSFVLNIHQHDHSVGFLFLPLTVIPICSLIFIFGSMYLKYNNVRDKEAANSNYDQERPETLESMSSTPAQIQTNDPARRGTVDSITDELMPMTIAGFEIPHTRVDFIPLIIALIILPVFLNILSTRMDGYHKYGKLDVCQYNMECSFPVGYLPDVGRAVTSLSYVFMGFTLLLLVFTHHRRASLQNVSDMITGVQHDYDILRAICYCLVFQGFIGFIFHVCPNESVESLADVFLLVSIAYACQKVYQNRHPDVRHQIFQPVYVTVFCLGVHGIITVPIHRESISTWALFGGMHALFTLAVPIQFVLLESFNIAFHPYLIYKQLPMLKLKLSKIHSSQMACLAVGITLNLLMMVLYCFYEPPNFKTYLIPVFVINLLLYLAYYLTMKIVHYKEKVSTLIYVIICVSLVTWLTGLYHLVFNTSISPGIAPALSREGSKKCVVLDMFDGHDAWHFLSATAMFLTCFLVMIVDDRQRYVQTCHLPVF